jgi:hypothetical protein
VGYVGSFFQSPRPSVPDGDVNVSGDDRDTPRPPAARPDLDTDVSSSTALPLHVGGVGEGEQQRRLSHDSTGSDDSNDSDTVLGRILQESRRGLLPDNDVGDASTITREGDTPASPTGEVEDRAHLHTADEFVQILEAAGVVLTQVPPQQPAQSQAELSDFVASAVAAGLQPVAHDFAAAFTQGQPAPLVWTSDRAPGGVVSSSQAAERNVKAEADMGAAAVERMVSSVLDMNAGQTLASSRLSGS